MEKIKLTQDMKNIAAKLPRSEVTIIVRSYYQRQDERIRENNRLKAIDREAGKRGEEPPKHELLDWLHARSLELEHSIQVAMDHYSMAQPVGRWMRSIDGIGPVLAAGFLAELDITKAPTAGQFWRFAGLDPSNVWLPREKRPWNADLKVLCWKCGQCFTYVCNKEGALYGKVYKNRKKLEIYNNEQGKYADAAKRELDKIKKMPPVKADKFKKSEAYKILQTGKLPKGGIQLRSQRYAVKLFLSHLHHVMFVLEYGKEPPAPYAFNVLGHDKSSYIAPPNWPMKD